jgi:hypothetical protein
MALFGLFSGKKGKSDEPDYERLTPDEVELEFKIRLGFIKHHTGKRLDLDLDIIELLATKYKYMPAIEFCIDKLSAFGREKGEFYEKIGADCGDPVCLYRYYNLERIKKMPPSEVEECIGRAVKAGATAAYLTLGDYYLWLDNKARALEIYKLSASLSVKGAYERVLMLEPSYAPPESTARPIQKSGLSARLKGEKQ